jgi:hypothetical protein
MSEKLADRRKRIYEFYIENRSKGKKFTIEHYKSEGVPRQTIYDIIRRAENDSGHQRVRGSGRVAKVMTPKAITRLKAMFDHSDRISMRQAARKFKCDPSYICKTLAKKTSIKNYAKENIPDRQESQQERIKTGIDRVYRDFSKKSVILDDESYFTLSHSTINGNGSYYSSDRLKTPASVKYCKKRKFEPKVLVWLAGSEKGFSEPFFVPSGLAINKIIYEKECIEKRLLPFINKHHADGNYVFWPDLASSHYAKTVTDSYETHGINFVKKDDNPPAVPECRPIEDFWSILKGKVYENNWQARDISQLRTRIKLCLKKIDIELVKSLFGSTRLRVSRVRTKGLIENKN